MELWYTEEHSPHVRFTMRVDQHLYTAQSAFQRIDIMKSNEFGNFLTLDNCIMLTEKDEFIYHDMLVHVAMATHPGIAKVLVIGGGDGGTVRELARYKTIEQIDVVEVDEVVVEACKTYFAETASSLGDPRVTLYFQEGLRFVRGKEDAYDLIIVDSMHPFGAGEALFTKEFYGNCYKALTAAGVFVNQHESPYYQNYTDSLQKAHERMAQFFPITKAYQAHIPTYPSGQWLFGFASKKYDPIVDLDAKAWEALGLPTDYYNTDLHVGAFALPNYVKRLLNEH